MEKGINEFIQDLKKRGPAEIDICNEHLVFIWKEGYKIPIKAEYSLDGKKKKEGFVDK